MLVWTVSIWRGKRWVYFPNLLERGPFGYGMYLRMRGLSSHLGKADSGSGAPVEIISSFLFSSRGFRYRHRCLQAALRFQLPNWGSLSKRALSFGKTWWGVAGKIMGPQRVPHSDPYNPWICCLTYQQRLPVWLSERHWDGWLSWIIRVGPVWSRGFIRRGQVGESLSRCKDRAEVRVMRDHASGNGAASRSWTGTLARSLRKEHCHPV